MTITAPHPGLPSGAFLIGDERLDEASGGWYDHVNPTTGLVQNRIPIAGTSEVDVAVDIARRAFPAWRAMGPNVRRNLLLDLADMSLANLVRALIIRYRKRWLRGDSPGASSHTIVGVHGKWRCEMRVQGCVTHPGASIAAAVESMPENNYYDQFCKGA